MAESYRYNVIINASVSTGGVSRGSKVIDEQMTRWEKRALKAVETIKKAFKSLEKAGIDFSKIEQANAKIIAANEKVLRAVQKTEAEKLQLSERTRREQIRSEQLVTREVERSGVVKIRTAILVGRENERLERERVKFAQTSAIQIERLRQTELRNEITASRERTRLFTQEQRERERAAKSRAFLTERTGRGLQTAGGGIQTGGIAATAVVTAPLVAGLSAAVEIGVQYEQSMNLLQAVTSATAEEMERADALAIKLGNDLALPGVSAKDAAEAMTELGKAGMTASEAMDAARGTLQLSTAANISASQAAEITANALNMFSLNATEAGRVADLLAGAANASSAEITDIALSLQQAGAVFANAKIPIEDVVTLIGEMANAGIKGSDAGTSLKTMLQRLQSPTDGAASAMKALNIEIYDQQGRMKPMRDIIGQFEKSLGGLSQKQKDQALNTIFGADAVRAATIVFKAGTDGFDKMSEAVQRANAAQELAAARTKGLGGAWEALKSQAETVGLMIYNRIKVPLTVLLIFIAQFIQQVTDYFFSLSPAVQNVILIFAGLASAVGPVLIIFGSIVVAIGSVVAAVGALGGVTAVFTIVAAALSAIPAILMQFAPVILTVIAVVAALYAAWVNDFGGLQTYTIQVWNTIVDVVTVAGGELYQFVLQIVGQIISVWQENYPLIEEIVIKVGETIKSYVGAFLNAVAEFWTTHGAFIRGVVNAMWQNVKDTVFTYIAAIGKIINLVLLIISGDWQKAWQVFLEIVQNAARAFAAMLVSMGVATWNAMIALGKYLFDGGGKAMDGFSDVIAAGLKFIVIQFLNLPITLLKLVPSMIQAGWQIGQALFDGVRKAFTEGGGSSPNPIAFDVNSLYPSATDRAMQGAGSLIPSNAGMFQSGIQAIIGGGKQYGASETEKENLRQQKEIDDAVFAATGKRVAVAAKSVEKLDTSVGNLGTTSAKSSKALDDFNSKSEKSGKRSKKAKDDFQVGSRGNAVIQAAAMLGIKPVDLATIISYETRGTFNPNVRGGKGNNYQGLIQFGAAERKQFGVYKGQSFEDQVTTSVVKYFQTRFASVGRSTKGASLLDLYKTVNGGNPGVSENASDGNGTIIQHVMRMRGAHRQNALNELFGGKTKNISNSFGSAGDYKTEKTVEQLTDEKIYNDAKGRVESLIQLSRELGVALTVPTEVTSTNQDLIVKQQVELSNLERLKTSRTDILKLVGQLGLSEADYARTTQVEGDASLAKLNAIDEAQKLVNSTYDDSVKKLEEMRAKSDGTLTALDKFDAAFASLQKASGLSREEVEKLNPKLSETRQRLQEVADVELTNKVAANFREFHEAIDKEIEQINSEIDKAVSEARSVGLSDATRKALDDADKLAARQRQTNELLGSDKFKGADAGTQDKLREDLDRKFAAQDRLEAASRAADTTKTYAGEVEKLNEALRGNLKLTDRQKLEIELTTGSLKNLTDAQKDNLRVLQQSVDEQRKIEEYNARVREIGDDFGAVFADSFTALFTKGIDGALGTLEKGLKSFFKNIWLNVVNQFAKGIQRTISDKVMQIFGIGGGDGKSGGGLLSGIFGGNRSNSPQGTIGSYPVVPFNPNTAGAGNLVNIPGVQMLNQAAGANNIGANVPTLTTNGVQTALGGAARSSASGLPLVIAGGNRAAATRPRFAQTGKLFGDGGILGRGGIFGDKGFGFNTGTISTVGALGGIAGSLIGGTTGSVLTGAASGIGIMSSLAPLLKGTALAGPVGLAIGAAIGGGIALFSALFGKSKQRKADEKQRTEILLDSKSQMQKLIEGVGNDTIDADSALSQANQIRADYLSQVGQLKDKKTRNIALATVRELDALIETGLKPAIAAQKGRKDRLAMLTPTFADGGAVSQFAATNYQRNPLGYVRGAGTSRSDSINAYFPAANQFARISHSEYVLDAETVKNIGVANLDNLRAAKGKNLSRLLMQANKFNAPFADGGSVGGDLADRISSQSPAGAGIGNVSTTVIINQDKDRNVTSVETETVLDTPAGKRKLESTIAEVIYRNGKAGEIPKAINYVNK